MKLFFPVEGNAAETRAALVPAIAKKLCQLEAEVVVEAGLGKAIDFPDKEYEEAGASVVADAAAGYEAADVVLRLVVRRLRQLGQLPE